MLYVNRLYGPPGRHGQMGAALIPENHMAAAVMHPFNLVGIRDRLQIFNAPAVRVLGHLS